MGLGGSDPDSRSKKLRDFHQLLWNKKLPNGQMMYLEKGTMSNYLIWNGMRFGSDSIVTQHRYKKCEKVIREEYIEFFLLQDYLDSNGSVTLFFPHKSFCDDPLPKTAEEYIQNIEMQRNIVKKRNKRI